MRVLLVIVVALSMPTWLIAQDRIDLRDGKPVTGKIQQEVATHVIILTGKGDLRVPLSDIENIHYDGQPAILTHARAMEQSGKLNQAADEYAKAQTEASTKPFILQTAQFGEARVRARLALDEGSRIDETVAQFEELLRTNPDSRHRFMALEFIGQLWVAKKDYRRAEQAFDELSQAPWPEAKLRSAVFHSRSLRSQGKLDDAITRLNSALLITPESPGQAQIYCEMLLEKAQCLRALDRRDTEVEALETALERVPTSSTLLHAQICVALGEAYRALGKSWEAVWSFVTVQVLFPRHEELRACALYNLSQLWNELGRRERAAAAESTLKTDYPNSQWARKLGS
jgi:tetratricopeptide (TPR) repeat protein